MVCRSVKGKCQVMSFFIDRKVFMKMAGAAAVTKMTKKVDGMGTNKSKEEKYMIPKKSQTIKLKDANSTNIPVYIKPINLN